MADRETEYTKLLAETIPPYTSIILHPDPQAAVSLGGRITFQSTDTPRPESAGGLVVDDRNIETLRADPVNLLGAVQAGGSVILRIPAGSLARPDWEGMCRATSLEIRTMKTGEVFSSLAVKSILSAPRTSETSTSILIPIPDRSLFPRIQESIFAWTAFLLRRNMYDRTEFVLVDDGVMDTGDFAPFAELSLQGRLIVVQHYKAFGPGEALRSGFVFASGRRILVDETAGSVDPESLLPMLLPLLREEKKTKAIEQRVIVHGFTVDPTSGRSEKSASKSAHPLSNFRLYSRDAARIVLTRSRKKGKGFPSEALSILRREGWAVADVIVDRTRREQN